MRAAAIPSTLNSWMLWVLLASWVTFLAGVMLPAYEVMPRTGDLMLDALLLDLGMLESAEYSIFKSLSKLLGSDRYLVGITILLCSVVFPIGKLTILTLRFVSQRPVPHWLHHVGHLGLLDVVVVALVIMVAITFPGGTRVEAKCGIYFFGISVLGTMVLSYFQTGRRPS